MEWFSGNSVVYMFLKVGDGGFDVSLKSLRL